MLAAVTAVIGVRILSRAVAQSTNAILACRVPPCFIFEIRSSLELRPFVGSRTRQLATACTLAVPSSWWGIAPCFLDTSIAERMSADAATLRSTVAADGVEVGHNDPLARTRDAVASART
jgi:hypothetical protein